MPNNLRHGVLFLVIGPHQPGGLAAHSANESVRGRVDIGAELAYPRLRHIPASHAALLPPRIAAGGQRDKVHLRFSSEKVLTIVYKKETWRKHVLTKLKL